jgi:hypothetical protein
MWISSGGWVPLPAQARAHGEAGQRERARQLISDALSSYRELGMQPWADKADELERTNSHGPRG